MRLQAERHLCYDVSTDINIKTRNAPLKDDEGLLGAVCFIIVSMLCSNESNKVV